MRMMRRAGLLGRLIKVTNVSFDLNSFDSSNSNGYSEDSTYTAANGAQGYPSSTPNSWALFKRAERTTTEINIYYKFNLSSIPSNAKITEISCQYMYSTSATTSFVSLIELCDGTSSITNTPNTLSTGNYWYSDTISSSILNLSSINNPKNLTLHTKLSKQGTTFNPSYYFAGATITLSYEYYS